MTSAPTDQGWMQRGVSGVSERGQERPLAASTRSIKRPLDNMLKVPRAGPINGDLLKTLAAITAQKSCSRHFG
jgi:hypothetical protein